MAPVDLHAAQISRNDTVRRSVLDGLKRPFKYAPRRASSHITSYVGIIKRA